MAVLEESRIRVFLPGVVDDNVETRERAFHVCTEAFELCKISEIEPETVQSVSPLPKI